MLEDAIKFISERADDLLAAAILVTFVVLIYHLIVRLMTAMVAAGKLSNGLVRIIRRMLRWLAIVMAFLLMLQSLDLLENAWTTLTAIMGLVAIGFVAVWSVLSNALCSIILLINRPFEVGDTVEFPADNIGGKVVNFNMIFTRLQADDGKLIQVPNNFFFQKALKRTPGDGQITLDQQFEVDEDAI